MVTAITTKTVIASSIIALTSFHKENPRGLGPVVRLGALVAQLRIRLVKLGAIQEVSAHSAVFSPEKKIEAKIEGCFAP